MAQDQDKKGMFIASIIDNVSGGRMCTVGAGRVGPSPVTRSKVVP